jgi:hypothetical protein
VTKNASAKKQPPAALSAPGSPCEALDESKSRGSTPEAEEPKTKVKKAPSKRALTGHS